MSALFRQHGVSKIIRKTLTISKPVITNFYSTSLFKEVLTKCSTRQFPAIVPCRSIKSCTCAFSEETQNEPDISEENKPPETPAIKKIPVETSIRYLKSKAYQTTYGNEPVWVKYRRNFKGQFTPKRTRPSCVKDGKIATGSPCPICRDEYLVLHYTNVDLLKQFIHPQTGKIYDSRKIHVCQVKLLELEVAVKLAKMHGYLTYDVPFRTYDYNEYYPDWKQ